MFRLPFERIAMSARKASMCQPVSAAAAGADGGRGERGDGDQSEEALHSTSMLSLRRARTRDGSEEVRSMTTLAATTTRTSGHVAA